MLSETHIIYCKHVAVKNTMASTVGAITLMSAKGSAVLPTSAFPYQCKCQPSKKANNILYIIKMVMLAELLKGS